LYKLISGFQSATSRIKNSDKQLNALRLSLFPFK